MMWNCNNYNEFHRMLMNILLPASAPLDSIPPQGEWGDNVVTLASWLFYGAFPPHKISKGVSFAPLAGYSAIAKGARLFPMIRRSQGLRVTWLIPYLYFFHNAENCFSLFFWMHKNFFIFLCWYSSKPINSFSTRPHQNVVWYNNSLLGFLKILMYVNSA